MADSLGIREFQRNPIPSLPESAKIQVPTVIMIPAKTVVGKTNFNGIGRFIQKLRQINKEIKLQGLQIRHIRRGIKNIDHGRIIGDMIVIDGFLERA